MRHIKYNGQGYLFYKKVIIDEVLVKALKVVETGQKSPFFKCMATVFFFLQNYIFLKILLTQHYTGCIFLDFDLHLV